MQRLALFDLDNTLVDRAEAFQRWAAEFCDERGLAAEDFDWMVATDNDGFVQRDWFFGEVRQRFGLSMPADQMWAQFRRRMPELVTCHPEVLAALASMREQGWQVAIVTNGHADNQLAKIRRTGLAECVDAWAVSGELGIRKPAREIFEAAAAGCGCRLTDGGWAIGDSPELDIEGGRAAGLATVWVRRGRVWPAELQAPDRVVDDVLSAVEAMLAE